MTRHAPTLTVASLLAAAGAGFGCGPDAAEAAAPRLGVSTAAVSQCGPRLWVAHDPATVLGNEDAYWNCILGTSNFSGFTSAYSTGTALYYGGSATIAASCSVVHSSGSATVANDSATLQCIENQTNWPVGDNDVILYYPQGFGCQDGRNHWGIPLTAPNGAGVTVKAAFVFANNGQQCQEALGFHETFEAAGHWSAGDCCNGQDGCTAPTAWGWYGFNACGGTYYAQYITPAAHEFDSAYCTKVTFGQSVSCNVPLSATSQLTGNDAITAVNWPADGELEVFAKTTAGNAIHVYTNPTTSDTWTQEYMLTGTAECGLNAIMWPPPRGYFTELFDPATSGSTQHLWWSPGSGWNAFSGYGAPSGVSLSKLGTLAWNDGHVEVFALGSDGQAWHDYWDFGTSAWSGWFAFGGTNLVTAPSPILWADGHGEVFATDATGQAWHTWSGSGTSFPKGWHAWASLGGSIASRVIPVRWPDGHVEVFGRGADDVLYASDWTSASGWASFTAVNAGSTIQGDPSVIANVSGKGASPGPEIFARDSTNQVIHAWWNGSAWTAWSALLSQSTASDPFGWIRADGSAVVFAVDPSGNLMKTYHDPSTGWSAWASLGSGIDSCTPPPPGPDAGPDAGSRDAGSSGSRDAGPAPDLDSGSSTGADGGVDYVRSGCGCSPAGGSGAAVWFVAALLGLRRRLRPAS